MRGRPSDAAFDLRFLELCEHRLDLGQRPVVLVVEVDHPRVGALVAVELMDHYARVLESVERQRRQRGLAAQTVKVTHDDHVVAVDVGQHPQVVRALGIVTLTATVVVDGRARPAVRGDRRLDAFTVGVQVPAVFLLLLGRDTDVASRADGRIVVVLERVDDGR